MTDGDNLIKCCYCRKEIDKNEAVIIHGISEITPQGKKTISIYTCKPCAEIIRSGNYVMTSKKGRK